MGSKKERGREIEREGEGRKKGKEEGQEGRKMGSVGGKKSKKAGRMEGGIQPPTELQHVNGNAYMDLWPGRNGGYRYNTITHSIHTHVLHPHRMYTVTGCTS